MLDSLIKARLFGREALKRCNVSRIKRLHAIRLNLNQFVSEAHRGNLPALDANTSDAKAFHSPPDPEVAKGFLTRGWLLMPVNARALAVDTKPWPLTENPPGIVHQSVQPSFAQRACPRDRVALFIQTQ